MTLVVANMLVVLAELQPSPAARSPLLPAPLLALGTGILALALLVIMIVSRLWSASARRETNDPRRLLRQLCEAHGFRRRQQRVLMAAAAALGVQQPARFFLEPALLETAAAHPKLSSKRNEITEIAGDLFGPAAKL